MSVPDHDDVRKAEGACPALSCLAAGAPRRRAPLGHTAVPLRLRVTSPPALWETCIGSRVDPSGDHEDAHPSTGELDGPRPRPDPRTGRCRGRKCACVELHDTRCERAGDDAVGGGVRALGCSEAGVVDGVDLRLCVREAAVGGATSDARYDAGSSSHRDHVQRRPQVAARRELVEDDLSGPRRWGWRRRVCAAGCQRARASRARDEHEDGQHHCGGAGGWSDAAAGSPYVAWDVHPSVG
jgi:hypothetical protein